MKPTFIGIGAQKCATTWLYRALESHPEAALSHPKELHFFSKFYDHGYRWYEAQFPHASAARAVGEYSTSYLCEFGAAERAYRYGPDLQIIVALRDPIDRAFSNHLHEVRSGHLGLGPIDFDVCESQNPMYVEQGLYARHLAQWFDRFGGDRVLVLFQEEIVSDPHQQLHRLYRFLRIDDSYVPATIGERINDSAVDRSPLVRGGLKGGAAALTALGGQRLVARLRRSPWIKSMAAANKQSLTDVVPPITDATRRRLLSQFGDDMLALSRLLGRDSLPWRSWDALEQG